MASALAIHKPRNMRLADSEHHSGINLPHTAAHKINQRDAILARNTKSVGVTFGKQPVLYGMVPVFSSCDPLQVACGVIPAVAVFVVDLPRAHRNANRTWGRPNKRLCDNAMKQNSCPFGRRSKRKSQCVSGIAF